MEKRVVSIEELRNQSQPLVDISGYEPGEFITFRLRRMSLMTLCKTGKIPNSLLSKVTELFTGSSNNKVSESEILQNVEGMDDIGKILDVICEASMVEPTFEEAGEFLTDNQKMEIFQWTQGGVKSLESFRAEQGDNGLLAHEPDVQSSPQ